MKPGSRWTVAAAPKGFVIPDRRHAAKSLVQLKGVFDGCVLFVKDEATLKSRLATAMKCIPSDGAIWIAWPKKSVRIETSLNEDIVQRSGLATGLVDNKVCAIDEHWSGLRFVVRLEDRKRWPSPEPG